MQAKLSPFTSHLSLLYTIVPHVLDTISLQTDLGQHVKPEVTVATAIQLSILQVRLRLISQHFANKMHDDISINIHSFSKVTFVSQII